MRIVSRCSAVARVGQTEPGLSVIRRWWGPRQILLRIVSHQAGNNQDEENGNFTLGDYYSVLGAAIHHY